MSGKLTRKERAELQRAKQQAAPVPVTAAKKKTTPVRRENRSFIRGLNIILIVLVIAIYGNSLANWYALDDYGVILENTQTKRGTSAVFEIFKSAYRTGTTSGDNVLYRPLSKAMFAIEWSLSERGAGLSHFMNLVCFALSIVLLFKMLRLYMRGNIIVPFITALIFAAHPIHTEVVANIKGRDDIMCFLFFVLTAIYVHRYTISAQTKHLAFAAGAFFLCCLSKESAITFVAVIPLMLYFFTEATRKTFINVGAMLGGVTILFLLIRAAVLSGESPGVPVVDNYIVGIDGFLTQRITAIAIAGIYLLKLFVPYSLVSDASVSQIPVYHISDWQFLVPFVIFLAAFAFAVMKFKSKHPVSFGILYFFITFSLVSNIVFLLGTNYAERLLYAPSLGICFAVAYLIAKIFRSEETSIDSVGEFFRAHRNGLILTGVIVIAYSFITIQRNPEWSDNETLYSTDLGKSPNSCKLHYYYANHLVQLDSLAKFPEGTKERERRIDTAIFEFRKSISLYPAYTDPMDRLGQMFFEKKMIDSSGYYHKLATTLAPRSAIYHNNYGRMLFVTGQLDEAQVEFESAIRLNPGYAHALNNLASVHGTRGANYVNEGKKDTVHAAELNQKAVECYQKSLEYSLRSVQYDPNYAQGYQTTAITYASLGNQAKYQEYMQLSKQVSGK
ncbi:MAG TPA: glycosyltransferase family 39 protein [Bacteroidia bacterium]|nr:glycosyltransferase family 39 protein [Bacteroidia bacterium]